MAEKSPTFSDVFPVTGPIPESSISYWRWRQSRCCWSRLKASHRETKRHRPLHSTYLIASCHIFIPLHTQTGVKFEIDNITDLFWEQRPRLGCAGALFFKFYFDARAQSSSAIGLALNPHTHRHTHTLVCISGLFGSASLLAFQVECLYSASASKRRPFMSSVLRDSNRTQLPNFLLVKEKSFHPKWVRTGIKTTAGRRYWDDS